MPRPLRVALGGASSGGGRGGLSSSTKNELPTLMPVDEEVCLPLPVLLSGSLTMWQSPSALVGGKALKKALADAEATRKKHERRGSGVSASSGSAVGAVDGGVSPEVAAAGAGSGFGGGGDDAVVGDYDYEHDGDGDGVVDTTQEVSVPLPPSTFDRKAKVVERHSRR